jgi:hypothetical protein
MTRPIVTYMIRLHIMLLLLSFLFGSDVVFCLIIVITFLNKRSLQQQQKRELQILDYDSY